LKAFYTEYKSRLSKTVQKRLVELARHVYSKSNGDVLEMDKTIGALTSANGMRDPETSRLSNFIVNLHRHFKYKDTLTSNEFIKQLLTYGIDI
jgi:hypothetical protein